MPMRGVPLPVTLSFLPAFPVVLALAAFPAVPASAAGPAITPADGSTVTARTVAIRVQAPAGGGRLLVDGVERDSGRARELTYTLDGRKEPNGTHRVRFDATLASDEDSAGTFKLAVRPAAPTGVSASLSGRTVTVTWNANPEPDINGYTVQSEQGNASTGPCSGTCRQSFEVPASATGALAVGVEAKRTGAVLSSPTSYNFVDLDPPAADPPPQDPVPQPEPAPDTSSPGPAAEQPAPAPSGSPEPKPSGTQSTAPAEPGGPDAPGTPGTPGTTSSPPPDNGTTPLPSTAPSLPDWLGPQLDPSTPPTGNPDLALLPSLPAVAASPGASPAFGLRSGRDPLFQPLNEHAARGTALAGVLFLALTHLGLWSRRRRLAALAPPSPLSALERITAERAAIETAVETAADDAGTGRAPSRRGLRRWRRTGSHLQPGSHIRDDQEE
ncbi:hypothetical protein [Actinocorallia aurantiaca]|uniref:Fibronectin type-III domain-containing protein n=1 Tax=Actinocorallia aurantiaca TaxID=46204 RepID=A0ABN3U4C3_9ACTN